MKPQTFIGNIVGNECVAELTAKNKWVGSPGDRVEVWLAHVLFLAPTPGQSNVAVTIQPYELTRAGALQVGTEALNKMGFK